MRRDDVPELNRCPPTNIAVAMSQTLVLIAGVTVTRAMPQTAVVRVHRPQHRRRHQEADVVGNVGPDRGRCCRELRSEAPAQCPERRDDGDRPQRRRAPERCGERDAHQEAGKRRTTTPLTRSRSAVPWPPPQRGRFVRHWRRSSCVGDRCSWPAPRLACEYQPSPASADCSSFIGSQIPTDRPQRLPRGRSR